MDYFRNIVENWDSLDKDRVLRENVVSIEIENNGMANILLTMPLIEYTSGSLGRLQSKAYNHLLVPKV